MGKTFVEDERPCDLCVNVTRYGCVSWNCEYINRDEAIKAWREKHETADHKTEPTISKMEQVDKDINVRSKDEPQTVLEEVLDRQTDEDRRKMAESVRKAIKDEPQTERSE